MNRKLTVIALCSLVTAGLLSTNVVSNAEAYGPRFPLIIPKKYVPVPATKDPLSGPKVVCPPSQPEPTRPNPHNSCPGQY